ncbi:MAG: glycosyltransferase family 39 protein [Coxiellaceae bacterium]|nr:glycosyltransferase family 39 protein [Coxiellaceae bacterium]
MKFTFKSYAWDLLWLGLLITSVFFIYLGIPALSPPDEPRYAEIPREMLAQHQFIIPHLNGLMYFEKPPLAYWIVAGFMKVFGLSEWAIRASVAVMGMLGCLATYAITRRLFNRRAGILSALILSSSLLYFVLSHMNTTDMSLTFCLTLSLYSFLITLQSEKPATKWLYSGYFFSGLAMMTKGLIGIAFPAMILFIWIAFTKNWRLIKNMRIISGFLIILAVNVPWLLLVQQRVPDFLHFYFIEQQILRYATPIAGRPMSPWIYLGTVLLATFPWVVFLPQALKYTLTQKNTCAIRKTTLFLLIWPIFIAVFFAFSHSILIPYLLPITPPLAIILGRYIDHMFNLSEKNNALVVALRIFAVLTMLLGAGFFIFHHFSKMPTPLLIALTASAFFFTGFLVLITQKLGSLKQTIIVFLIGAYLLLVLGWLSACMMNKRSIKPLAITINALIKHHPKAEIVNYGFYLQDLPYYTRSIVTVVGNMKKNDFNELTYGIMHNKASKDWMIDFKTFWKRWNGEKRIYAVIDLRDYHYFLKTAKNKFYFIQKTSMFALVSNKALK